MDFEYLHVDYFQNLTQTPQTVSALQSLRSGLFVVVLRSDVDGCLNGWSRTVKYVAVLNLDENLILKVQSF